MSDSFQQGQYAQHYAQEYTQQHVQQHAQQHVQQHSQQHVEQHAQHMQQYTQHAQQHEQQYAQQHEQQYAQQHEQQHAHARDEFELAVEGFQDEYDSLTYIENEADNFHPNDVDTKVQKDDGSVDKDGKMLPPRNVNQQDKYRGGHVIKGSFSSTSPGTKTTISPLYSHNRTWNNGKRTTNTKFKNKHSCKLITITLNI
jgi:exonuclease VII large subunit